MPYTRTAPNKIDEPDNLTRADFPDQKSWRVYYRRHYHRNKVKDVWAFRLLSPEAGFETGHVFVRLNKPGYYQSRETNAIVPLLRANLEQIRVRVNLSTSHVH